MAVGLGTGVPWVMCKQGDAPDPIVRISNNHISLHINWHLTLFNVMLFKRAMSSLH